MDLHRSVDILLTDALAVKEYQHYCLLDKHKP